MSLAATAVLVLGFSLGQVPKPVPDPVADSLAGLDLTVYLLTFDPGAIVWERFGHNAVWIRDNRTGRDWAYDYGRFDFGRTTADQFRFAGRFARGLLDYSMGDSSAESYLEAYAKADRSIWSQELDLPPAARAQLRDFLEWNKRAENRVYPYNYFTDNCSTRIRDAIDAVVGGQLRAWADTIATPWTFRDHTRRTTENGPGIYTALMLGLGRPVDQPLSAWEAMFLPIELRPYLDQVAVRDPDGRVHPLVKASRHLVENERYSVAPEPHDWTVRYLAVGTLLAVLLATLGHLSRRGTAWRLAFGSLAGGWALVTGLGGLILVFLWALTNHRFSFGNENVLQLNVISLGLAAVLPSAIWWARARWVLAVRLALAAAVVSAVGLLLKLVPGTQANLDMIALVLPVHLGLWFGLKASGASPHARGPAPGTAAAAAIRRRAA